MYRLCVYKFEKKLFVLSTPPIKCPPNSRAKIHFFWHKLVTSVIKDISFCAPQSIPPSPLFLSANLRGGGRQSPEKLNTPLLEILINRTAGYQTSILKIILIRPLVQTASRQRAMCYQKSGLISTLQINIHIK